MERSALTHVECNALQQPLSLADLKNRERVGKWLSGIANAETRRAYERAIKIIGGHKEIGDWQRKRYSPSTKRLMMSALRSYARHCKKDSPAPHPPLKSRKPNTAPVPDLKRVQQGIGLSTATGARDWLIFYLLQEGYTIAQICGLRAKDLRLHENKLCGNPVSSEAIKTFHTYFRLDWTRRKIQHTDTLDHPLLQGTVHFRTLQPQKPMTPQMVRQIIRKWCSYAGISCNMRAVTMHVKQVSRDRNQQRHRSDNVPGNYDSA